MAAGILERSSNKGFITTMFTVPKDRPIFNFKKLSTKIFRPNISIFKSISGSWPKNGKKYSWPKNLFYFKLDIAQAFFNINVHKKSQYLLTIKVNGKYYFFTRLSFSI